MLPGADDAWDTLTPGAKEIIGFPSGEYEFIHNTREQTGGYKACSLFSPMGDFKTQAQAVDVAKAVMVALFNEENRADTDRAADIRAAREAELAEPEPPQADLAPTRRKIISAGMADD
jgi:[NiFe] hydrogenase assembly HybE family chaperone